MLRLPEPVLLGVLWFFTTRGFASVCLEKALGVCFWQFRKLSRMTATMGLSFVTERCLKNHHRLYYLKRNGSNWFASTLKKPLWLMNVFLRKTEKSAETPVTWSMSKQPSPCKLFCVCESSCLGHSKTMVGTQGGRGEFRISCPPMRCVFLWVSDRKNIGWGTEFLVKSIIFHKSLQTD